jgi:hypothetical protein
MFGKVANRLLSIGLNPAMPRLTIGLWGPRGTGKTTSLAMLPIAAEETRWKMEPLGEAADGFVARSQEALVVSGRFPDPPAERMPVPYSFAIGRGRSYVEKVRGMRRADQVTFQDAPGAWCERPIPLRASADSPIEYLTTCDGILFFLDPVQMRLHGADYGASIVGMLDSLRRRLDLPTSGRLPHRIAFVVPRVDEDEQWKHRDRIRAYVMEQVGMVTFQDIVDKCQPSRYRFFGFSSIGRVDGRSNLEQVEGQSRIANPAKMKPFRLFDSLEWMLEGFA